MGKGWVVKGYSAFSGDSAVLGGLCGERGCCPFAMVAGMEKVGATGGASSSPTKSEGDSAVLEGLVQAKDGGEAIPPVVARFFFGRQHLTFDKGGKFSTGRGDGCAFEKVVEIERVDATGGASKARMP